jgi:NADH:ubiquinone oxidoreductase subunit H
MSISSILFTFLLFLVGWASKNKYSILASNRIIIISFNLEIFLNFLFIFLIILFESFSFYQISSLQSFTLNGFFMCLPIMPLMVVTFLIETGRIPFDLGEAESEFPGESKAVIKKMASELCAMFWKNFQRENAKSQASG